MLSFSLIILVENIHEHLVNYRAKKLKESKAIEGNKKIKLFSDEPVPYI